MYSKYHDPAEGNRRYQRALAQTLVSGLGRDAAREACAENGWEGVAKILLPPHRRRKDATANKAVASDKPTAAE
jgi:hypothetical protein